MDNVTPDSSMESNERDPSVIDFVTSSDFISQLPQDFDDVHLAKVLFGSFAVWNTQVENFDRILEDIGASNIGTYPMILGTLGRLDLEAAGILQAQNLPYLGFDGQGVLLGFVDTGIDYTKESFIYEDGSSKIVRIWDQTAKGQRPEGYWFGAEYTNEEIDRALRSEDPLSVVPHQDNDGHGTFLASVAGSVDTGDYIGAAPRSDIIMVKLRGANPFYRERYLVPADQQNAFESTDVMLGVEYILEQAVALGRPVSICIGLGSNSGGHDGFSAFEEYLTRAGNRQGVCITIACGNESNARHHTMGKIPTEGASQTIEVKTNENSDPVLINLWTSQSNRLSVSLISPGGAVVARQPARPGVLYESRLIVENVLVQIRYYFPVENTGSQMISIRLIDPSPGIWTIVVYGDIVLDGVFHAWLPMTGFVAPGIEFLAPIPNYTITAPGTAQGIITTGAFSAQNGSLYPPSSWGPSRMPAIEPSFVAPGVNVSGMFPTGYGTASGTSASAAITAGACALMLDWGIVNRNEVSMNTYLVRAFLIRGCDRDAGIEYPNNQWGYGRLNLLRTMGLIWGT